MCSRYHAGNCIRVTLTGNNPDPYDKLVPPNALAVTDNLWREADFRVLIRTSFAVRCWFRFPAVQFSCLERLSVTQRVKTVRMIPVGNKEGPA
jgi:hypothetical protein